MEGQRIMGVAAIVAGLALGACAREEAAEGPPAPTTMPADGPAERASYIGRWAATPELCSDGAWAFEEARVVTAGEVACDFQEVTPIATGYEVSATCWAEGPPQAGTFMLTLTDPAPPQTMSVTGGPWAGPVTLVRCPW